MPLDSVEQSALPYFHIVMKDGDTMASIGIRLPEQEKRELAALANRNDMTISQVMRKLIREYIDGVSQAKRTSCQANAASGALASQQEQRKEGDSL